MNSQGMNVLGRKVMDLNMLSGVIQSLMEVNKNDIKNDKIFREIVVNNMQSVKRRCEEVINEYE